MIQQKVNENWIDYNTITVNHVGNSSDTSETEIAANGSFRVAVYDQFDHVSSWTEFNVDQLILSTVVIKANGNTARQNETLAFIEHGDMEATIDAVLSPWSNRVTYSFDARLHALDPNIPLTETRALSDRLDGMNTDEYVFTIPDGVEMNELYSLDVTAWRISTSGKRQDSVTQRLYIQVVPYDYSKYRSVIIYQSGMKQ